MKICIYGAGAIGTLMAGRLAAVPGVEVSLIARGGTLETVRRNGVQVRWGHEVQTSHVRATEQPAELGPQDYVFVTLKAQQLNEALAGIGHLLGTKSVVVPPTTTIPYWYFHSMPGPFGGLRLESLDPGMQQWSAIAPERVLGCVFRVAAQLVEPGVVRQTSAYAKLPLGEPDGSQSARATRLSQAMQQAGFDSPVVPDIRGWLWHKMISSLCWNPLAVLTHAPWGDLAQQPQVNALARRMMQEADAIAAAVGGRVPISVEERMSAPRAAPAHKMSMLQDLELGRPLEFEPILASLRAMQELVDRPTPTIDEVYALMSLRARAFRSDLMA